MKRVIAQIKTISEDNPYCEQWFIEGIVWRKRGEVQALEAKGTNSSIAAGVELIKVSSTGTLTFDPCCTAL